MKTNITISMLTSIRNGFMVNKEKIKVEYSKINVEILTILVNEGYIKSFSIEKFKNNLNYININLSYVNKISSIQEIKAISKGKCYKYVKLEEMQQIHNQYGKAGKGTLIFTTNKGVLTGAEAIKKHVGGKLILGVF